MQKQRKKNLLTAIFKHIMGIYTHTGDIVSRDTRQIQVSNAAGFFAEKKLLEVVTVLHENR